MSFFVSEFLLLLPEEECPKGEVVGAGLINTPPPTPSSTRRGAKTYSS
jgi:hypothetical protein